MSNPVHPKVLGSVGGATVGGFAAGAASWIINQLPALQQASPSTREFVYTGLVGLVTVLGGFVGGYFSKEAPKVNHAVDHAVDAALGGQAPNLAGQIESAVDQWFLQIEEQKRA